MVYVAPGGWFENIPAAPGGKLSRTVFHMVKDCPAIRSDDLTVAARPRGAKRCTKCAAA
jgi:hypothetical protein